MKLLYLTLSALLTFSLQAKEISVEQLFSVQTVKVKKEQQNHTRKNYGFVKIDEARVHYISPRFAGFVEKIYADTTYTYVHKGDPLVTLYSPEVYKAKEDYLNSYHYTKKRKNLGILKSAELKLLLLGVDKKEIKKVLEDEKVSKNTTIYAPINGYIFQKNISNGSAFNAKENLFKIVNLDEVWVEVKIYTKDRSWIKNAKEFDIGFISLKKHYRTTTKLLYPQIHKEEATFTLRLKVKNEDADLFPGMYATIISKDTKKSYLTLPSTAVIRKNGKYYVFIVGEYEGEYEPIEVKVIPLNNSIYIIKEGLSVNEEVLNNALFMMDSDAQINGLY